MQLVMLTLYTVWHRLKEVCLPLLAPAAGKERVGDIHQELRGPQRQ
jgi:hypothetical protein